MAFIKSLLTLASVVGVLAISGGSANPGICPRVGAISDCGVIITITDTGSTVTITGEGPYDGVEDTMVGVVNNSKRAIKTIGLRSALPIFDFDGDGIVAYGVPGNAFDSTGYGGPNAYFTNTNFSLSSGTVNFIVPLAANGGSGYFSLEETINAAYSCPDIINDSVTTNPSGANMDATFTPKVPSLTLQQAAYYCGVTKFDWVQKITRQNDPANFYARNIFGAFDSSIIVTVRLTSSRTPYNDPPFGGGYANAGPPDYSYPFYYDPTGELGTHEIGGNTLTFHDAPADGCMPDGAEAGTPVCDNTAQPNGSSTAFTTRLAGVDTDGSAIDLGIGFTWISNYNGTTGGAYIAKTDLRADGNGTGGVTITGIQNTTNYEYKGIGISTINGVPVGGLVDTIPPVILASASPSTLWPANGKMVSVTVSGKITDNELGGTGINLSTAVFTVIDKYGQLQPKGVVSLNPDGSFSFTISLQASRNGD